MGVMLGGVAGAAAMGGCGLPSSTLAIDLAAHGALPVGMTSAEVTVAEIDVDVDTKDHGEVWVKLLDRFDGDRAFDLAQLIQQPVLASERDVPAGAVKEVDVFFDDNVPSASAFLPWTSGAPTELKFPVGGIEAAQVTLVIDFDLGSSLQAADGGYVFSPVARLEESP